MKGFLSWGMVPLMICLLMIFCIAPSATLANDYDIIGHCQYDLLAPSPIVTFTPAPPQPVDLTPDVLDKYSPAPMSDAQLAKFTSAGGTTVIRSRTVVRSSASANYAGGYVARAAPVRRVMGIFCGRARGRAMGACSY